METEPETPPKTRPLSDAQLAARRTNALSHGLNAKDENARRLRDRRAKQIRRRVKKELAENPHYGPADAQRLRRAIDLEIILDDLIALYDLKGGAAKGQATLQTKILAFTDKARAWRQTLPECPDAKGGSCDLSDPAFKLPLPCWQWIVANVLADADAPSPADLTSDTVPQVAPTPEQLIQEAEAIIEGGSNESHESR